MQAEVDALSTLAKFDLILSTSAGIIDHNSGIDPVLTPPLMLRSHEMNHLSIEMVSGKPAWIASGSFMVTQNLDDAQRVVLPGNPSMHVLVPLFDPADWGRIVRKTAMRYMFTADKVDWNTPLIPIESLDHVGIQKVWNLVVSKATD